MLIFGSSTKVLQLAMLNLLCNFCGNPSAQALRKRVTKFTLFFIPLFPIAPAKHTLQCTFCGGTQEVSKENVEHLLAAAGAGAPNDGNQPPAQGGNPFAGNPFAGQPQPGQPPAGQPYPPQGQPRA
ncbi:zinc-ribbon domain-containing protein [Streptomyces hainanensis]|uniref:Zinc-ribbon domain-containing protein n=1 Tax=Streptomyces hainanensis TaxID=402648 RepID=A0A4V2Y313_9ACTN|nr:zinc-ribbon domain-containing protein [Streptomyces hainanensis]TDC74725.1 zinc-ribbon domain-containing protein [Streptomyces hainanensis]